MDLKNNKWMKLVSLTMGFPSTIFTLGWGIMKLVSLGHLSKFWGSVIFVLFLANFIFLLIRYAVINKN